MHQWLSLTTEIAVVLIDGMALIVIMIGTVNAFFGALRFAFAPGDGHARRQLWLRYTRWLVAALTFQLAADILESSISPDWQSVGRLAAIAAIRTFLNYFLERDITELRAREHDSQTEAGLPI